jgi:hypothetical protein
MPTLHLVDGEKGGTGKSWVARTMHHVFEAQKIPFIGVDADTANPTYKNVYPDVRQIPFGIDHKTVDLADAIFQHAISSDVIVNLPAQSHYAVHHWFSTKDVALQAKANNVTVKKWWISDGENDSIHLFLKSIEAHDSSIQHIFLQNLGRCDEWEYFDTHQAIQQAIREHRVPVIAFPVLGQLRRIRINAERMTFEQALSAPTFGILGQAQVGLYLKNAAQVFQDAGAFGAPSERAMATANLPMPKLEAKPHDAKALPSATTETPSPDIAIPSAEPDGSTDPVTATATEKPSRSKKVEKP